MGLLYAFPVSLEETDFVDIKDNTMTLKTYGLPYIFWGYATAVLMVIFFMFLAVKAPVLKLVDLGDETDAMLGYSLLSFIGSLPVLIFSFFFFEKRIVKKTKLVTLEYRVFGLKLFSETFTPNDNEPYLVGPFLTSPNLARLKGGEESAGFQNKGYFCLWLNTNNGKVIQLDRSSRKADLVKLEGLLQMIP
jgi:hypothetical protein